MMPGYVLSVTQLYNLTGDKAFMEEMREIHRDGDAGAVRHVLRYRKARLPQF